MERFEKICTGEIYHVYSRSVGGIEIFRDDFDYQRMLDALTFFRFRDRLLHFHKWLEKADLSLRLITHEENDTHVDLLCYCLMPNHVHFILLETHTNGIATFMGDLQNSYAKYLNATLKRKGGIWQRPFQAKHVNTNEQLFHLTRYIHLNPVTAYLCAQPQEWKYSSFAEYTEEVKQTLCQRPEYMRYNPVEYMELTMSHIQWQRELALAKKVTVPNTLW